MEHHDLKVKLKAFQTRAEVAERELETQNDELAAQLQALGQQNRDMGELRTALVRAEAAESALDAQTADLRGRLKAPPPPGTLPRVPLTATLK